MFYDKWIGRDGKRGGDNEGRKSITVFFLKLLKIPRYFLRRSAPKVLSGAKKWVKRTADTKFLKKLSLLYMFTYQVYTNKASNPSPTS